MRDIDVQVLEEIKHPLYTERKEIWSHIGGGPNPEMHSGYALDGSYIGNIEDAKYLCEERGIKPEKRTEDSTVSSVGYSDKEGKWFGWSHRAISGYPTREQASNFAEEVS